MTQMLAVSKTALFSNKMAPNLLNNLIFSLTSNFYLIGKKVFYFAGTTYPLIAQLSSLTMNLQSTPVDIKDPNQEDLVELINFCQIFKYASGLSHCGSSGQDFESVNVLSIVIPFLG